MDKIHICDLKLSAIIGTLPDERINKQELLLNITLYVDMRKAGDTDDLHFAVDYSLVEKTVTETVEKSSCKLLEALAEKTAAVILAFDGVKKCKIRIDKPGAGARAASIAVEIERAKE